MITGVGLLSPIGNDPASASQALQHGRSGVRKMPEWSTIPGLHTQVGAPVLDFDEKSIPRAFRRSMGRVGLLAAAAAQQAVQQAKLEPDALRSGRIGISLGQTVGSPGAMESFFKTFATEGPRGLKSTTFLQMMGHSAAANLALMLGLTGRLWAPAAACASGSQAIGQGYETIRDGHQDAMICGGSEELHLTTAVTFDIVGGTSRTYNDSPSATPRPFDLKRDGLVVGEGAGVLVLEERERALARGAEVLGEVLGFATFCDGHHLSSPERAGMARTIALALASAGLSPDSIDYINGHGTGTEIGDPLEAAATADVFGDRVRFSSTKGHTGHTLAASGALEAIFCLSMIAEQFVAPTLNLENVDPACAGPRHLHEPERMKLSRVMSNNFAFGGVNTSLVFGAPE